MEILRYLGELEQEHVLLKLRDQFHDAWCTVTPRFNPPNTEGNCSGEENASYTLDPNHQQVVLHS